MKMTDEKYRSFKDLMFKIAGQHDCVIKMTCENHDYKNPTKIFISDALVPNSEYHILWDEVPSLTEAAVTVWANFFSGKDSNVKYNPYNPVEKDIYHLDISSVVPNYIKRDLDMTKAMFTNIRNGKCGILPSISRVIFNPPATIVFWSDKSKTVVKAHEDDEFDPEKGLAMAISKKALGNKGYYYNTFSKWIEWPEDEEKQIRNFINGLPSYSDDLWNNIRNKLLESFRIHVTADKNGKVLKKEVKVEEKKYNPVEKAYMAINDFLNGESDNLDEALGYLGEALDE